MNDLRDVTIQYVSCPDPTESAARKIRVFQGETRNLMENTALGIISAASGSELLLNSTVSPVQDSQNNPRISQSEETAIPPNSPGAPSKRGRGRPPLQKQNLKTAATLVGSKSQKRNFTQGSPKKLTASKTSKKVGVSAPNQSLPARASPSASPQTGSGISKSKSQRNATNTTEGGNNRASSSSNPKINLIPASKKKKVDFQNLPTPLP